EKADGFFPGEKFCDLEFEKISFSYVPDEIILNDVSFSVKAGQTIAVVGPTGSGKTTLVNLVIRFYDPSRGRVMINGCDLRLVDPSILRSKMAIVAQDPFLSSSTVRENIFQGISDLSEEKIDYVLDAANCRFVIERLPDGLDTNLSEGGLSISSGERQLISIARAFAHDPELIIFDEATSYIDSGTEAAIQEAMTNLMNEKTAIIVAHRLSTARNADMIIVLDKGKIIESGTHPDLMKKQGFYYQLHQFREIL
ncbi:ATP-binding cassette domain-containing protein, partial [Desulfobacterales bacterium HSG16]|nr:ATP-binding cassette domain-containing protein [Desulfobacterales bacterium HSG16]